MGLLPLREYGGGDRVGETTTKTPPNSIAETASFILIRPLELARSTHSINYSLEHTPATGFQQRHQPTAPDISEENPVYKTFFCFLPHSAKPEVKRSPLSTSHN
jgi:hypothetical protein